ncbi:MAG: MBL fold metallo-hydrolase [Cyclobacteriaceae bacterium]|nr:MBL fold metallo-hydrolase [Cyclobacteriaceae bacterium]
MITVHSFVFNPFSENTYVLFDETKECVIIDPGCFTKNEQEELISFIQQKELTPKMVLNTHCHIDHVLGNSFVKSKYNIPLWIPKEEVSTFNAVPAYAEPYGFAGYRHASAEHLIEEGEEIKFGNSVLKTIYAPGHSAGHVAFVNKEQKICVSGDILFYGSIGRTDLPGGDFETLINSIHNKIFVLSDDTTVYCGHGQSTTIGHEKATNPFCAVS